MSLLYVSVFNVFILVVPYTLSVTLLINTIKLLPEIFSSKPINKSEELYAIYIFFMALLGPHNDGTLFDAIRSPLKLFLTFPVNDILPELAIYDDLLPADAVAGLLLCKAIAMVDTMIIETIITPNFLFNNLGNLVYIN